MRSGSPAPGGGRWPSAQDPYRDQTTSGPGPYGEVRHGDVREGPAGGREMPFGPEISWPNGFRRLDTESRRLLESGYRPGGYGPESYDPAGNGPAGYGRRAQGQVDPGYRGAAAGYGNASGYRQPAMDDYGYGDPGYSDPAYEGPRDDYGGSLPPGGSRSSRTPGVASADGAGYGNLPRYHAREFRESSRSEFGYPQGHPAPLAGGQDIYPVTGAQEALPATGPQRALPEAAAREIYPLTGAEDIYPVTGAQEALPATGPQPRAEAWAAPDAGFPQADTQTAPPQWYDDPRPDDQRGSGPRPDGPAASDPRLQGMRYDELRYEEPPFGASGYDEPLDDDSWYEELRRSAPQYPQRPGGPSGPDHRPAGPRHGADPRASGHGQQPGYPQAPAHDRTAGYGQARDDRGGPGPRMSTGRDDRPSGPAAPQDLAYSDPGYLGAPSSRTGVLTPPAPRRLDPPANGRPLVAAGTGQLLAPQVRPGHGLDGPEITSSWPAQPHADELESFEEFWAEDDDNAYRGLFPDEGGSGDSRGTAARASRGTGRRRGRSRDHRLWLALIGVVLVAAAAIVGILRYEFPSNSGPVHTMVTPDRIGTYGRTVDLEKQTHLAELRGEVIKMSSGQASGVVSAVYEEGNSAAGGDTQIIMFIGGHLANAAPATSIEAFTQKFAGATVVRAGSLGGRAACVENGAGTADPVSMCVWFDNDSFGEIVSPTLNAASLASAMQTVRPAVEQVTTK